MIAKATCKLIVVLILSSNPVCCIHPKHIISHIFIWLLHYLFLCLWYVRTNLYLKINRWWITHGHGVLTTLHNIRSGPTARWIVYRLTLVDCCLFTLSRTVFGPHSRSECLWLWPFWLWVWHHKCPIDVQKYHFFPLSELPKWGEKGGRPLMAVWPWYVKNSSLVGSLRSLRISWSWTRDWISGGNGLDTVSRVLR